MALLLPLEERSRITGGEISSHTLASNRRKGLAPVWVPVALPPPIRVKQGNRGTSE